MEAMLQDKVEIKLDDINYVHQILDDRGTDKIIFQNLLDVIYEK
jgi:hypothetical protein